jgi:hypothetical protein
MRREENGLMVNEKEQQENEIQQPEKPANIFIHSFIAIVLIVIASGLMMIFITFAKDLVANGIIERVYYFVLLIFAIAAAIILFKVLGSTASFKGKKGGGILKIGGPAVVALIIIILGFKLPSNPTPFGFTIFLRDEAGKTVLINKGSIRVNFSDDPKTETIDEHGGVDFKGIPANLRNQEVTVELDAPGWQFINGKVSTPCKLEGNNAVLTIERDNSLCCISGTVLDDRGNGIPGVRITVKSISTVTDESGWFSLTIPKEKQAETQRLTIQKEGYVTRTSNASPGTKAEAGIVLEKK